MPLDFHYASMEKVARTLCLNVARFPRFCNNYFPGPLEKAVYCVRNCNKVLSGSWKNSVRLVERGIKVTDFSGHLTTSTNEGDPDSMETFNRLTKT